MDLKLELDKRLEKTIAKKILKVLYTEQNVTEDCYYFKELEDK